MGLPVGAVRGGQQRQRHPDPVPRVGGHGDGRGASRRSARAWTSRCRATSSACCSRSTAATARRWPRPCCGSAPRARFAVEPRSHGPAARAVDGGQHRRRRHPRGDRPTCTTGCGLLVDPHTAVGLGAAAPARRPTRRCPWSRWPPRTRPSSPTRSRPPPGCARRCPTRLADLFDRPERYETVPTTTSARPVRRRRGRGRR